MSIEFRDFEKSLLFIFTGMKTQELILVFRLSVVWYRENNVFGEFLYVCYFC